MKQSYCDSLLDKLKEQRRNGEYCDIEIQVEDQLFYGHKCILSAASPCLESNIRKAEEDLYNAQVLHRSHIKVQGISSDGFRAVMDFIYSGEAQIDDRNVDDISNAAMILDIPTLIKECVTYKSKQLVVTSYNMILPQEHRQHETSPSQPPPPQQVIINASEDSSYSENNNSYEISNSAMLDTEPTSNNNHYDKDDMEVVGDPNGLSPPQAKIANNFLDDATTSSASHPPECSGNSFVQSFDAMNKDPTALPTLLPVKTNSMMPGENEEWSEMNLKMSQRMRQGPVYSEELDENGQAVWRCLICKKLFNKLSYLKYVHIRLHDGNRPHTCSICGKTFATKGNLLQHHKSHLARSGILPFKCRYCKKGFSLKGNCLKHEKTHTKPYRCEFCLKSFSVKSNLLQHIAKVHENIADQATVGSQCSKCHKTFPEAFGEEYLSHKCGVFLEVEGSSVPPPSLLPPPPHSIIEKHEVL